MVAGQTIDNRHQTVRVTDHATWAAALSSGRPVLTHLNADTTWLVQLPYPASSTPPVGRTHFNILVDPWLRGPQSDVASWFSTQWHVVAPCVQTMAELNSLLAVLEEPSNGNRETSYVDAVAISHEFTDHCHQATLLELPKETPVFATEKAAELVRSWGHFGTVITTPEFGDGSEWRKVLSTGPLPQWVGIGRVVTKGNALYYHSAVMIIFDLEDSPKARDSNRGSEAIIYSPHGIKSSNLVIVKDTPIRTLALLHGLHDVRIRMTKQLNLGAMNGIRAVAESGARYWIATHDEVKKGGGMIAPMLRRTEYTLKEAMAAEAKRMLGKPPRYDFVELGSGDGLVLQRA